MTDEIIFDDLTEHNADTDIVSRARAFEDYLTITNPKTGKRSADYLLTIYQRQRKDGHLVPTTNRTLLYSWKTEDKWEENASKRDLRTLQKDRQKFEDARYRALESISLFAEEAVESIVDVMRTGDNKLRLEAAKTMLSRFGIPEMTPKGAADAAESNKKPETRQPIISPDADEEALDRWLGSLSQGSRN